MSDDSNEIEIPLRDKLNTEAALIRWHELQTFFAGGQVVWVSAELNLLDVAVAMAADDAVTVKPWVEANQVYAVTDAQAAQWYADDATLWGLVVRPFVLVQNHDGEQSKV
mgnify:CR=1 FL=1|jgi:hypothetical protein